LAMGRESTVVLVMVCAAGVASSARAQMCWWAEGAAARRMVAETPVTPPLPAEAGVPVAAPVTVPGPRVVEDGEVRTAEELLSALERADQGLVSLTADVLYDKVQSLMGDRQTRFGRLAFVNDAAAAGMSGEGRKFAINFDRLVAGDVERPAGQTYVFDGEWLLERDAVERLIVKTRLVAPGEQFDPLAVGRGPLPIPIGQKKAEILSRYDARLVDVEEGLAVEGVPDAEVEQLRAFVAGCVQVRLTPRAERAEEDELTDVRLWYRRTSSGRWLPRLARAVNTAGDVSTVQLINVETQDAGAALNEAARPPAEWFRVEEGDGWRVEVREGAGR
jgi:hypothetical protein